MADNLVLGRGKLFFAPFAQHATSGGVRGYFGNTPTLTMTQTNTKLDHYSSEGGLKVKDRSVLLQTDVMLAFDTDNIDVGNVMLWFGGVGTGTLPGDAPSNIGTMSIIGKANAIYGAMFFESDNPVGDNMNWWFPYVMLAPTGSFALKGDTWQTISFQGECLKRDALTERAYAFTPAAAPGSDATADTTPMFTPTTAAVAATTYTAATGGTATAPGTNVHGTPFTVSYTLTGGTIAYAAIHNGTANVTTPVAVTGASGTVSLTAPASGTDTVKLYSDSAGTAVVATSSSITVS